MSTLATERWLIASASPGISPRLLIWLYRYFGELESALCAPDATLHELQLSPRGLNAIKRWRDYAHSEAARQQACDTLARAADAGVQILCLEDDDYPPLLAEISSPPALLYLRGQRQALAAPALAMVGSRHPTPAGRDTARHFSRELARAGFAVASGMALGIDAAAHQGALDAEGITLGVLGTGVDVIYPRGHRRLAEQIMERGALLSEMPLGEPPRRGHFPRRNRIISGLSLGVLVVEAAVASGSLITANFALEQNREVFAVPGSIHNPVSRGCHLLLRQGAALVETADDILQQLQGWAPHGAAPDRTAAPSQPLSGLEQQLLEAIGFEATPVDTIMARVALPTGEVAAGLIRLEIKGLVQCCSGGYERATALG